MPQNDLVKKLQEIKELDTYHEQLEKQNLLDATRKDAIITFCYIASIHYLKSSQLQNPAAAEEIMRMFNAAMDEKDRKEMETFNNAPLSLQAEFDIEDFKSIFASARSIITDNLTAVLNS